MLKTRNLIFALSLSPLLSFAWQLPNQAQSFSPSKGTAGVDAGAATSASQTSGFSTPTTGGGTTTATTTTGTSIIIPIIPGVSATITTGVSTTGNTSVGSTTGDTATGGETAPVAISAATIESTSSSVTVTEGATANTVVITLAPQVQVTVNQLAAAIVQTLSTTGGTTGGATDVGSLLTVGAGSPQATVALTNSFTAAGISPQLTTALVTSLSGLFNSTSASLPNQPVAQIISGQMRASNKTFKPVYVIAQGSAGLNVNINKLNDAIIAYNRIILQSEPNTLRNLSRNTGFVGIGSILKQLRTEIKQPSI